MKRRYKKILTRIGVGVWILFLTLPLYAFGVSPGRLELSVAPGETRRGYYEISNTGDKPIHIQVETKSWVMDEQGGISLVEPLSKWSRRDRWISISPKEIVVKPNSIGKIRYEISMPKNASGEYSVYLMFRSVPNKVQKEALGLATQISVPLYVIVKGREQYGAQISEVNMTNAGPIEGIVSIYNSGNVHIRPVGEVAIRRKNEEQPIVTLSINTPAPGWPILPKQNFKFMLYSTTNLEPGDYILDIKFAYNDTVMLKEMNFSVAEDRKVTMR